MTIDCSNLSTYISNETIDCVSGLSSVIPPTALWYFAFVFFVVGIVVSFLTLVRVVIENIHNKREDKS